MYLSPPQAQTNIIYVCALLLHTDGPQTPTLTCRKGFPDFNSLLRPGEFWRSLLHFVALSYTMQGGCWWEKTGKEKGGGLGHASSYQNIKMPDL